MKIKISQEQNSVCLMSFMWQNKIVVNFNPCNLPHTHKNGRSVLAAKSHSVNSLRFFLFPKEISNFKKNKRLISRPLG